MTSPIIHPLSLRKVHVVEYSCSGLFNPNSRTHVTSRLLLEIFHMLMLDVLLDRTTARINCFLCFPALHHQSSEPAADDIRGHAGLQ